MSGKEEAKGRMSSEEEAITDDGKRWSPRNFESPFERYKKPVRSPVKKATWYDDTLLKTDITEIKTGEESLKGMFVELLNEIKEMKSDQRNFMDEIRKNREEITELKTENMELKDRLEKVEKKKK